MIWLFLTLLLLLILLRAPIAVALGLPALVWLFMSDISLGIATQRIYGTLNNSVLLAVPMFLVARTLGITDTHITLILFRTGSMSPTIPAGSVAIVQQIPASEVHVGDVVTVDRPGQLPVTHRVRLIEDGPSAAARLLTLRGDANAQDDPAPYPVSTVRIVRFAIPGLAPVIVAFGNPFVLGGLTLGASALVVWAFWPKRARAAQTRNGARDEVDAA